MFEKKRKLDIRWQIAVQAHNDLAAAISDYVGACDEEFRVLNQKIMELQQPVKTPSGSVKDVPEEKPGKA